MRLNEIEDIIDQMHEVSHSLSCNGLTDEAHFVDVALVSLMDKLKEENFLEFAIASEQAAHMSSNGKH